MIKFTEHPRLSVEETRFEENNSYILARATAEGIEEKVRFKVSNLGGSTATVKLGDVYAVGEERLAPTVSLVTSKKASVSPSGSFLLAPQEPRIVEVAFSVQVLDKRAVIDRIERIKNNRVEIPFAMEIYYESEPELKFKEKLGFDVKITPSFVYFTYSSH